MFVWISARYYSASAWQPDHIVCWPDGWPTVQASVSWFSFACQMSDTQRVEAAIRIGSDRECLGIGLTQCCAFALNATVIRFSKGG